MSAKKKKTVTTADDAVERQPHCYPAPCLQRDVIFNILLLFPAKTLSNVLRYVCKQWNDVVSDPVFAAVHCRTSTPGFLIQDSRWPHHHNHMIHIDVDTPTLKHATENQIPFPAVAVSCFNGLVLLSNTFRKEIFHVVNPLTKQNITLPPLKGMRSIFESTAGLGVDSSGSHYKVVYASAVSGSTKQVQMKVFTIGVDKAWRFIDLKGIPVKLTTKNAKLYCPQTFGGYIYWFTYCYYKTSRRRYGFALDIDTETIYQFSQPKDVIENSGFTFISTGTSLGFIAIERGYIWRVWELTDIKSGEWTELSPIDVRTLYNRFDEVFDTWVNSHYYPIKLCGGQLWLYRDVKDGNVVVRYNFDDDNMGVFPIKINLHYRNLLPYANTLVSPNKLVGHTANK